MSMANTAKALPEPLPESQEDIQGLAHTKNGQPGILPTDVPSAEQPLPEASVLPPLDNKDLDSQPGMLPEAIAKPEMPTIPPLPQAQPQQAAKNKVKQPKSKVKTMPVAVSFVENPCWEIDKVGNT